MNIGAKIAAAVLASAIALGCTNPAAAQKCTRQGDDVTCDDGRRGVFTGGAIIWPDGTRSSLVSPHPSVIVGNRSSVIVGQGVFVGNGSGKGVVQLENPSAQTRCPTLDGVPLLLLRHDPDPKGRVSAKCEAVFLATNA